MSLEEEAKAIERKERYIIFWQSYLSKKRGWENNVFFSDSLDLKDIDKAIGKENLLAYNGSAEVYEIKKVKKPLFPEEEDTLRFSFSKADIKKAIKKAVRGNMLSRNLGTFVSEDQLGEYLQCEEDLRNIGMTEGEYNNIAPLEGGCMSTWQHLVWEVLCATKSQSSWEFWYRVKKGTQTKKNMEATTG